MPTSINCVYAENPGGYCKNKIIRRSLFGIGARLCILYWNNKKRCLLQKAYTKQRPPPPPPFPTGSNNRGRSMKTERRKTTPATGRMIKAGRMIVDGKEY
jgi:hypothetical protein